MTATTQSEMVNVNARKASWIGQSAAKRHTPINCGMMKVQRLAERRRGKCLEKQGQIMAKSLADRFFEKTERNTNGCLEWNSWLLPNGYGQFHKSGKTVLAHRVAWEIQNGEVPADMFILHKCDNRKCVDHTHLFLGTFNENMADMVSKDRHARGTRNGHAKLTDAQVLEIRAAVGTHKSIGQKYAVTQGLVSMIRSGRIWRHI
jgi:hypothetical protein